MQVALKRAAVKVAEANLAAAESKARSLEAQLGSQRWKLQSACEQVDSQVALLAAQEANLRTQEATLDVARADYDRGQQLLPSSAISREDFDHRHQQYRVATANVKQAREAIHQTRAALGLSPEPEKGKSLTDVPPDLNQTFSDGPNRAGRLYGHDDAARTAAGVHRPDAEQGPRRVSSDRQGGRH